MADTIGLKGSAGAGRDALRLNASSAMSDAGRVPRTRCGRPHPRTNWRTPI